jgi:hypothetical protein
VLDLSFRNNFRRQIDEMVMAADGSGRGATRAMWERQAAAAKVIGHGKVYRSYYTLSLSTTKAKDFIVNMLKGKNDGAELIEQVRDGAVQG